MTGLALAAWLVAASPSEAPPETEALDDTGVRAPWGPGPAPWVSPLDLRGLDAYRRYQRVALIGAPIFASGVALGAWGAWAVTVRRIDGEQFSLTMAGATLLASAGGGAMTWGSYTALRRLYGGEPPLGFALPGYAGYGLLGLSSAAFVAGAAGFLLFPPITVAAWGIGVGVTAVAGVPGAIQTALNPLARRHWEQEHAVVRLDPWRDPRGAHGLALTWRW